MGNNHQRLSHFTASGKTVYRSRATRQYRRQARYATGPICPASFLATLPCQRALYCTTSRRAARTSPSQIECLALGEARRTPRRKRSRPSVSSAHQHLERRLDKLEKVRTRVWRGKSLRTITPLPLPPSCLEDSQTHEQCDIWAADQLDCHA